MKIIRNIIAALIALLMLTSMLAGCGKEDSTAKTTAAAENTTAAADTTTQKAEATTTEPAQTTAEPTQTNENLSIIANAQVGDIVNYGSYEQDNNTANGKEDIAWQVLAFENGRALLISEKSLDAKAYNEDSKDITWETCTLRNWLNNKFYNDAFAANEKLTIDATKLKNDDNPDYKTQGGKDTKDKVFLFSIEEAGKYFETVKAREAQGTDFAKSSGLWVSGDASLGTSRWWLRSPGGYPDMVCFVEADGIISAYGNGVDIKDTGVRPAVWINL